MLKQAFDKERISKVLTSSDIKKWKLIETYGDIENAKTRIISYWEEYDLKLSMLKQGLIKGKPIFRPTRIEDAIAIRLVDRFIRSIYKVRQSNRNRIIRQLISILKDSGNYHVLRLDLKSCYESIMFENLINQFENDLILTPECILLLKNIHIYLKTTYNMKGLPRGLSISPTLAEMYLEKLDNKIASDPEVIFSVRYVDDIFILFSGAKNNQIESRIVSFINEMGLNINYSSKKYYKDSSRKANFDFLGYSFKVTHEKNKPNNVSVTISNTKICKIKSHIIKCFIDHEKRKDITLLKKRLKFISMLKVLKKSKNGDLLGGIAFNYQFVNDEFECLKSLDAFLLKQLNSSRFSISPSDKPVIKKISITSNVKKKKICNFTKNQIDQIMRIWKNA